MRSSPMLILALACTACLAGCGGQDKAAMAKDTTTTYWSDIAHGKFKDAYALLTSGNQAKLSVGVFSQNVLGFVEGSAGLSETSGNAEVHGDFAVVPVGLQSPKAPGVFHAYQHLFWENGGWRISDNAGGLSQTK